MRASNPIGSRKVNHAGTRISQYGFRYAPSRMAHIPVQYENRLKVVNCPDGLLRVDVYRVRVGAGL